MGAREGVAVQAGMPGLGKEGRDYVCFLRTQEGKPGMFQTIFNCTTCVLKLLKRMKIIATSPPQSLLRTPCRQGHREGQLGERIWRQDTAGRSWKGKESDFVGEIPRNSVVQAHRLHCSETRVRMKAEVGQGRRRP